MHYLIVICGNFYLEGEDVMIYVSCVSSVAHRTGTGLQTKGINKHGRHLNMSSSVCCLSSNSSSEPAEPNMTWCQKWDAMEKTS